MATPNGSSCAPGQVAPSSSNEPGRAESSRSPNPGGPRDRYHPGGELHRWNVPIHRWTGTRWELQCKVPNSSVGRTILRTGWDIEELSHRIRWAFPDGLKSKQQRRMCIALEFREHNLGVDSSWTSLAEGPLGGPHRECCIPDFGPDRPMNPLVAQVAQGSP